MATLQLTGLSSSHLQYAQAGFDIYEKNDLNISGRRYSALLPEVGTSTGHVFYFNNPDPNAHWIGIHNCGTAVGETIEIQAETIGAGDDLSKGSLDPNSQPVYFELGTGDVVYGKFSRVYIHKTAPGFLDKVRLIRGAQYGT